MNNFFHRLFNPHCPHCREEDREQLICYSCEDKKMDIARMQDTIDRLLDRLLEKPEVVVEERKPASITRPAHVPWTVRKQMLEEQDRATAKLMRESPKPDFAKTVEDISNLEIQLGVSDAIPESNEEI